jgi:hypothetical protein
MNTLPAKRRKQPEYYVKFWKTAINMKILLLSLGTRGDCEPFAGLGEMLRERGEEVICAFPEQYRNIAEESGFRFYSLYAAITFALGSVYIKVLSSIVENNGQIDKDKVIEALKKAAENADMDKMKKEWEKNKNSYSEAEAQRIAKEAKEKI